MNDTNNNSSKENIITKNEINVILEKNNLSLKNDIIYFKEELLKELKELKQDLFTKNNRSSKELKENIKNVSLKNKELNNKIEYISKRIDSKYLNNTDVVNIPIIENNNEEIKRKILSNEIKIIDLKEEFNLHKEQYNNIIKNNIIYQGKIGPGCIYQNLHQFIDYIILNINNLNNFKDQKILNTKNYEFKIEKLIDSLNNQINSIIDNCKMYINQGLKNFEKKVDSELKLFESKLMDTRIENLEYSKKLEIKIKELDDIFNKFSTLKNDINDLNEKTKIEIFDSNDKINTLINNYQKEFISLKEHFNILSEFFKDLKSKLNLSDLYNKRDIINIANKINFNNNNKKEKRAESAKIKKDNFLDKKSIIKVINNINFELGGNSKNNSVNVSYYKTIPNKSFKKDEKIGDDKDINEKYESINNNEDISSNDNIISPNNKFKIRKILKNEKLEKYKFLYESNNNSKTNENITKKNYPDFCIKNYNNKNRKEKNIDIKIVVKNRNISALSGIKKSYKNYNRNIFKSDIDNFNFDNSFYTAKIYNNNNINFNNKNDMNKNILLNKIKNNLENNNNFIISKYYQNKLNNEYGINSNYTKRNIIEQEMNKSIYKDTFYNNNYSFNIKKFNMKNNNPNKSMENIFIKKNDENLFYKNLSNKKLKIKNLSCIK